MGLRLRMFTYIPRPTRYRRGRRRNRSHSAAWSICVVSGKIYDELETMEAFRTSPFMKPLRRRSARHKRERDMVRCLGSTGRFWSAYRWRMSNVESAHGVTVGRDGEHGAEGASGLCAACSEKS